MAKPVQDFQQAQMEAHQYAIAERKSARYYAFRVAGYALASLLTLILAPKLFFPGLLISGGIYLGYKYGIPALHKARNWWEDRKNGRLSQPSMTELSVPLMQEYTMDLKRIANVDLSDNIFRRQRKIGHYLNWATLKNQTPFGYYDYKHYRGLFQIKMMDIAYENALRGYDEPLLDILKERQARRQIKIDILKLIHQEITNNKISIVLKTHHGSSEGTCELAGTPEDITRFLNQVMQKNTSGEFSLITPPEQSDKHREFLVNTLLPVVIDMDTLVKNNIGQSSRTTHLKALFRRGVILSELIIPDMEFQIATQYLDQRIQSLENHPKYGLDAIKTGQRTVEQPFHYDGDVTDDVVIDLKVDRQDAGAGVGTKP